MSSVAFDLPETQVSKDVIERVQFSVSSRNAGSKVSECLTHVFVSPYAENPSAVKWQYVSSGVTCLLRKKEVGKSGRKLVWTVHLCLYNVTYGVLVWKGSIAANSCYTAVTDSFHVFVMQELNAIVGLLFNESSQAKEFLRAYLQWDADKTKEERSRGSVTSSPSLFRKEMISKPCNFQHIQGTQALDECMEIERIKTDIQATFFGLGSVTARRNLEAKVSGSGKRKKDAGRPRIQLQNVSVPHKSTELRRGSTKHPPVENTKSLDVEVGMGPRSTAHRQESSPADMGVRLSMPPPMALMHHQSHPDLLENGHSSEIPTPPQSMSPQSSIVPNGTENGVEHTPAEETSLDLPQTVRSEPQYDILPTKNPESPVSPMVQSQNSSGNITPTSPIYDGLVKMDSSPLYDSLQKNNRAQNADSLYQPQLYVDAIVEEEVAGYSKLTGEPGGLKTSQEYTPPPRLSPLSFEKEFSNSPFFHPAIVTSTTNC